MTRLDSCCLLAMVTMLLALGVWNFTGERGRIMQCTHNLSKLGHAMEEYAADNNGELPPASTTGPNDTWDSLLYPYLRPDLVVPNSAYAKRQLEEGAASRFSCPSDQLVRGRPRTYIMSGHDMQPENWPPGPDNVTGVGLAWTKPNVDKLMGDSVWLASRTNRQLLPPVKLAWLPDPANTLFLTELVNPANKLAGAGLATVRSAQQQVALFSGDRAQFHHGRFNYLMVDGHVELLAPDEIGNAGAWDADQPADIWTIKAGD